MIMWRVPRSRWTILGLVVFVVLVTDSTRAFVAPPSTTMAIMASSNHYVGQDALLLSSSSPYNKYSQDDLPLENYKNTATAMLDLLEQASQMIETLQSLTSNLETCKAIDPDIADYDKTNEASPFPLASLSTTSSSATSSRLDQAMQRALEATDTYGRFSRQAEQAWVYVTTHVLERNHPFAAYLSHPSYRYTYASSLLLHQKRQRRRRSGQKDDDDDYDNDKSTNGLQNVEQRVASQTQQISIGLRDMEEAIRCEISRLEDRELGRMALLKSLWK